MCVDTMCTQCYYGSMNKHEIIVAIKQTLEDIKQNFDGSIDIDVRLTNEQNILFSVRKENGRVQVYRIKVEAL